MVLKSEVGGSLTFEGCLKMHTRQQPLAELCTDEGGGDLFTVCSFYLFPEKSTTYLAYQYFSPRDLTLDNGRLININFDRTVAAAKTPLMHIYSILQSMKNYLSCSSFFKRGPAVVQQPNRYRVILLTSTDVWHAHSPINNFNSIFFFFVYV